MNSKYKVGDIISCQAPRKDSFISIITEINNRNEILTLKTLSQYRHFQSGCIFCETFRNIRDEKYSLIQEAKNLSEDEIFNYIKIISI